MSLQPRRAPGGTRPTKAQPGNGDGRRQGRPRIRCLRPLGPALERRAALSRVLALWPQELDDLSAAGHQSIVGKLKRALRAERRRGIAGHWTYDLARHVELLHLYRQELAALTAGPQNIRRCARD